MYYRKKYSGTISNFTDKRVVTALNGTATLSIFANQTDIVSAALIDILKDVGYKDARYDAKTGTIFFDKNDENGIFFAYVGNMQMGWRLSTGSGGWASVLANKAGTAYQPFNTSSTSYNFYLTVIGEPKGYMVICFGNSSIAESITTSIVHIYFGENVLTKKKMLGISISTGWTLVINANFTTKEEFTNSVEQHSFNFGIKGVSGNIVLLRRFTTSGYLFLEDVYFLNSDVTSSGQLIFMQYKGDVYWCPNMYLMVKCTTQLEA